MPRMILYNADGSSEGISVGSIVDMFNKVICADDWTFDFVTPSLAIAYSKRPFGNNSNSRVIYYPITRNGLIAEGEYGAQEVFGNVVIFQLVNGYKQVNITEMNIAYAYELIRKTEQMKVGEF